MPKINDYLSNLEFKNFKCPHCKVVSQMRTTVMGVNKSQSNWGWHADAKHQVFIATCQNCGDSSIWWDGNCVFPELSYLSPNADMPNSVKTLYLESSAIYQKSPRAACALLRLAVERLCNELGENGTIDNMIGNLVKKGLPPIVQKALDSVRVIGNKAVHPGHIAFDLDNASTAETLMKLLNIITERLITEPKEISEIFQALPESAKQAIQQRDK